MLFKDGNNTIIIVIFLFFKNIIGLTEHVTWAHEFTICKQIK